MSCAKCKHWTKPSGFTTFPLQRYTDSGDDIPLDDRHQHRICGLIQLADPALAENPPKAFTMDASNYHAALWTAPDFGCVLFLEETHET